MSRILFVSTSTTVGGAEKTLYCLATRLDPGRFPVAGVVSLKPAGSYAQKLAAQGAKTFSLEIDRRPKLKDLRTLGDIIRRERPDIVHALMYQAIQACRFVKKRAGMPFKLISSPRVSYRTRSAWTLLIDSWLKNADDLLITESKASRNFLIHKLGYDAAKVKTIYNGIDSAELSPTPLDRQKKRQELGLGIADLLIGTLGRLDVQKGHAVLLDALARLKNARAHCIIIGTGPLRDKLADQIRDLKLESSVRLMGECDDTLSWLSACDIFVLPSLWEGLPNALLEAMALGLPVIASSVDGVPEVVTHNHNGLLVPKADPAALARALADLIGNPAARQRLGESAQAHIRDNFSLDNMLRAYSAAYEALTA